MYEYTANFHQHTTHSDGAGTHQEVIEAGQAAGLNIMVFTDHNVYVPTIENWYDNLLVLMGIEVNDMNLKPEVNHYLCLGVNRDLNEFAANPQDLIDAVKDCGGVGFIAHPFEHPAPRFNEGAYPWVDWSVSGYAGLEIWNYMTEFKSVLTSRTTAVRASLSPDAFIAGPFPETLAHWDKLMKTGQKVVAIGNTDAHAQTYKLGPISRTLFPYQYLFGTVRTHLLMEEPLSNEVKQAKQQVLDTLRAGHCFVAYDLLGDTTGFSFTATNSDGKIIFTSNNTQELAIQGDEILLKDLNLIEMTVTTPLRSEIRLLRDGEIVAKIRGQSLTYLVSEPGVYRVECYRVHKTRWRGWIFSNPIYVRGTSQASESES